MSAMSAISPNGSYVVVWEWENRPNRWRPYSPEVTQLLERAHNKKLNRIYLKDAEPLLADFYINMTNFEQCCEPTGTKYTVRREFFPHTSPAGKGAKWEWSGEVPGDWHTYDMEVQVVLEESWSKGEQTMDISSYFPGCPYIINFCNLTQVRKTSGFVRPMRRIQQAAYPMVKLTQAEIAAMVGRREERRRLAEELLERRKNENKSIKRSKSRDRGAIDLKGKKTMKNIVNTLLGKEHKNFMFGAKDHKDDLNKAQEGRGRERRMSAPGLHNSSVSEYSKTSHNVGATKRPPDYSTYHNSRRIGHPSSSEANFPLPPGGRGTNAAQYRRFQDSSFSSFSDTSSTMLRRPSIDTISTYLSHESMLRHRYGHASQNGSSYYGSLGSQELLNMYDDEDSVFTEDSNEDGNATSRTRTHERNPSTNRYSRSSNRINGLGQSSPRIDTLGRSVQKLNSLGRSSQKLNAMGRSSQRLDTIATPSKRRLFNYNPQQTSTPNKFDEASSFNRSYSMTGNRVISDPSLSFNRPHTTGIHQHSNSDVINTRSGVSRGTVRPYSQDLSELQESFERELYVNQRQLVEDIQSHRKTKHRYNYIDDEESCGSTSPYEPTLSESMNPLPLPPKFVLGSQQSLLSCDKSLGSISSLEKPLLPSAKRLSLSHQALNSPSARVLSPTLSQGFGKKPIPAPRTMLNSSSSSISPFKHSEPPTTHPAFDHVEKLILSFSEFTLDGCQAGEVCFICGHSLQSPSAYPSQSRGSSNDAVVSLEKCHHKFHLACIRIMTENQNPESGCTYIECPCCGQVLGDKFGDQPETGIMSYKVVPKGLPGFQDYHSIQITYNFQNGTQNSQHPNPGSPYIAIGFPRTAFLPDTEKGRRVLTLLEKSFNAGHTFTVSQSGDIIWGSIPHRTEFTGEAVTQTLLDDILSHLNALGIYS